MIELLLKCRSGKKPGTWTLFLADRVGNLFAPDGEVQATFSPAHAEDRILLPSIYRTFSWHLIIKSDKGKSVVFDANQEQLETITQYLASIIARQGRGEIGRRYRRGLGQMLFGLLMACSFVAVSIGAIYLRSKFAYPGFLGGGAILTLKLFMPRAVYNFKMARRAWQEWDKIELAKAGGTSELLQQ